MADTIEYRVDLGNTLFDISVNTDHICMGLKQIPRKNDSNMLSYVTFRQRSGSKNF